MNSTTQPAAPDTASVRENGWRGALWWRMRTLFWLKLIGVTAVVWLFFVAYFHLLRYPSAAVTEMPLTAVDHWIAFEPLALGPYLSLWLYVGIAPGLMANLRQLLHCGLWAAALCATGLILFYLWPTAVPLHIQSGSIELLRGLDAAGNACPSLHVATATFSVIWIDHVLRTVRAPEPLRAANGLWFVAIVYSTLAIKQHVLIDVLAGFALGLPFAWLSLRSTPAANVQRL
ncbi:MAG: phosphatase PAP2 family protein [Rubrivivax sp.]